MENYSYIPLQVHVFKDPDMVTHPEVHKVTLLGVMTHQNVHSDWHNYRVLLCNLHDLGDEASRLNSITNYSKRQISVTKKR